MRDYNYIISVLIKKWKGDAKNLLTRDNMPPGFADLQNIFIESFASVIYSVHKIANSSGGKTPGVDGQCFKTISDFKQEYISNKLKYSKYRFSKKSFKIKKELPKKAIITHEIEDCLLKKLKLYNAILKYTLVKQCNIKSCRKSYRAHMVRCVGIEKRNSTKLRPLGIPTLRDRVLQQIIYFSLMPAVEFESDSLSFGFRPKGSAIQAISFIYNRLIKTRVLHTSDYSIHKTTKAKYEEFPGRKSKHKLGNISGDSHKRRRQYRYQY